MREGWRSRSGVSGRSRNPPCVRSLVRLYVYVLPIGEAVGYVRVGLRLFCRKLHCCCRLQCGGGLSRQGRPTFTGARALPQTGAAACKETYLTFVAASTVRGSARQRNLLNICDRRQVEEERRIGIETPALMESCRRWRQLQTSASHDPLPDQ